MLSAVAEDPQAFLEIFERHFDVVHRFLARQLGSAAAEDAAADVFLRALRGAASFAPDVVDARPWLFGIAANVIRAELRDRYRDQPQTIDSVETLETGRRCRRSSRRSGSSQRFRRRWISFRSMSESRCCCSRGSTFRMRRSRPLLVFRSERFVRGSLGLAVAFEHHWG